MNNEKKEILRVRKENNLDLQKSGKTTCLYCGVKFTSPDKKKIKRCNKCKKDIEKNYGDIIIYSAYDDKGKSI